MRRLVSIALLVSACSSSHPPAESEDAGSTDSGPRGPATIGFFTAPTLDALPVHATRAFWADVIVVRGSELPRGSVTLYATATLRDGTYQSWARFDVDASGALDTAKDAPIEGSWSGADPDGITWSMTKFAMQPDPPIPLWGLRVDVEVDGARIARAELSRYLVDDDVKRTQVDDGTLVGAFYAPNDGRKHPAVVTFGGSEGGTLSGETNAAYLSGLGYAALGVGYFAAPGLPDSLERIPLEYFDHAIDWLGSRPEADAKAVGVMGGSRGGELALLLGAKLPRVRAVVAQVPSAWSWGAPQVDGTELASWTNAGTDLPFLPSVPSSPKVLTDTDGKKLRAYDVTFLASVAAATAAQKEQAITHIEETHGPVLMVAGKDDRLWASCALSQPAIDRSRAHGRTSDELLCLENAGHDIPIPGSPTLGLHRVQHPITKEWLALGGTPQGTANAARLADTKLRAFLASALR